MKTTVSHTQTHTIERVCVCIGGLREVFDVFVKFVSRKFGVRRRKQNFRVMY